MLFLCTITKSHHPTTTTTMSQNQSGNDFTKHEILEAKSMDNLVSKTLEEQAEEEGECGFCLFMKGGDCKETFVVWEKCMDEAEENKEDIVEKCSKVYGALNACMEAHEDYYEPILKEEKAADELAVRESEREKA